MLLVCVCFAMLSADASGGLFPRRIRLRCRQSTSHCQPSASLPGYATPEAAWQAREIAYAKNDWKTIVNTLSPDYQFGVSYMGVVSYLEKTDSVSRDHAKEIVEVNKRHGVDLSEIDRDLDKIRADTPGTEYLETANQYLATKVRAIRDHGAYYADVVKVESKFEPEDEGLDFRGQRPIPVRNVRIEKDRASGDVSRDGVQTTVHFVRVQGRWYFEPESL
jgi:uncharacterized protein YchJ